MTVRPPKPFDLTGTKIVRGVTLIEASAGTGKTYAISALYVRLILEHNLSVREILVVTYTEAATGELRDRVRAAVAEAQRAFATGDSETPYLKKLVHAYTGRRHEMERRLHTALCDFDEAAIYTIHGFCQRTLRDRAFESGRLFDTELVTDPSELVSEVVDDFWRSRFYQTNPVLVNFALKNKFGPERLAALLRNQLSYPGMKFLSGTAGCSSARLAEALEHQFQEARLEWQDHQAEIRACFGSTAKWANNPYNADHKMADLYLQLGICFSESVTAFEALECLESFCPKALALKRNRKTNLPVPEHRFFHLCEKLCETEQLWLAAVQLEFLDYAREELPRRKQERKIQHFDDLITGLEAALTGQGGADMAGALQQRYKAALIDEFQDTDPVQYRIFRSAFGDGSTFLFLIGDPKQAIYGFRGADIFTYLKAASESAQRYTLNENRRSEAGLVTAVNSVFSFSTEPFVFSDIRFHPVTAASTSDKSPLQEAGEKKPPFQLWFWRRNGETQINLGRTQRELPVIIAAEIVRLLSGNVRIGDEPLKPQDIAVLVPRNDQAAAMKEALSRVNVPAVLHTDASLFESNESGELLRVLLGIALPGDERLVKSALATSFFSTTAAELIAPGESEWHTRLQRFHEYQACWERQGFFRMFRLWLQQEGVRARLLCRPDGERQLTNLLHLGEAMHRAETDGRLGVSGLLKWLQQQRNSDGKAPEEYQLRLERDDNAVRLVTVHKSKGLQYPVVFCAFCWRSSELDDKSDVLFHDSTHNGELVQDLGPVIDERHRHRAMDERLAESVRLFYVALTRAKHRCYFVWGGIKDAGSSAPGWVLHAPVPALEPRVPGLAKHFSSLSDGQLEANLAELARTAGGNIAVSDVPPVADPLSWQPAAQEDTQLACREFHGEIRRDWVISSFSSFHAGHPDEKPDRDRAEETATGLPGEGMFAFPRGTLAGTCLHAILERVDFTADPEQTASLVRDCLVAHGFGSEPNVDAVRGMLRSLVSLPLPTGNRTLLLKSVPPADRLNEMEFYFPVKNLAAKALYACLGEFGWQAEPAWLDRLKTGSINGFLKGFIDLVFRSGDRFYIVDWKSNWLGSRVEDYTPHAMRQEMQRRQYHLQYHLYSVALHKFLTLRLPGYNYQEHFGGVFYIFLRGLDPARPGLGVFHDVPSLTHVERLAATLESAS